jgi:hypothetical protein
MIGNAQPDKMAAEEPESFGIVALFDRRVHLFALASGSQGPLKWRITVRAIIAQIGHEAAQETARSDRAASR